MHDIYLSIKFGIVWGCILLLRDVTKYMILRCYTINIKKLKSNHKIVGVKSKIQSTVNFL